MARTSKKIAILKTNKDKPFGRKEICLQHEMRKGEGRRRAVSQVTIGGSSKLKDDIWDIHGFAFDRCGGDPNFYTVTKGCERIQFNCTYGNFQKALDLLVANGYELEDGQVVKFPTNDHKAHDITKVANAQVSTPHGHVFQGEGSGETGRGKRTKQ